jgi:FAD/FMN-containing dehydrogenase
MVRKYGLTIDSVLSATVVTARGDIVTASPFEHPDLFWAIRGGGGNFGIVTEFEFRLAPVGQILGGDLVLPATREVIRGYLDYIVEAPDDLTTLADVMRAPPAPFIPEERVGEPVLHILVCWTGDQEAGERAIAPLRALATPVADVVRPMPYPVIYESTAELTEPAAVAIRSMFADGFSDEAIASMLESVEQATSPIALVHLRGLGGAMARVGNDETAFAHRHKRYLFAAIDVWLDASEDPGPHNAWAESTWQKVRHEGSGVYVNFLGNEGEDRIREAYPEATHARLREVKRMYDPTNVFQFNQNIRP